MAYADDLKAAMAGVSRRALSFKLAALSGNKQESEYRALGKYLNDGEMPEPKRAARMARALDAPELANVPGRIERRQVRQAELEARVDDLDQRQRTGIEEVTARLVGLEERLERLEQRVSHRRRDAP
jgi:hypothetical protein